MLYPVINMGIKHAIEYHVEKELISSNIKFEKIHISPEFLTPVLWKVIVEDGKNYKIAGLSIISYNKPMEFICFKKAGQDLLKKFSEYASIFTTYLWFADYPVMKTENSGNEISITFGDLRFFSTLSFLRNLLKNHELPFSLTAILDENRDVKKYYFYKTRGVRIIQHLE